MKIIRLELRQTSRLRGVFARILRLCFQSARQKGPDHCEKYGSFANQSITFFPCLKIPTSNVMNASLRSSAFLARPRH